MASRANPDAATFPPWIEVLGALSALAGVIGGTLAVLVFLAQPLGAAAHDLAGAKTHPIRHLLRLVAFALVLVAVAVSIVIGGETAGLGAFMVPIAAAAACAAVGMDLMERRRRRRAGTVRSPGVRRRTRAG